MQLGMYTFAELTPDPRTGQVVSPAQRLRDLVEEIELADQVGLDVFGVGEHHRPDFAVSAPAVVLAAAAERTRSIRLTSAVSVLSSDDPVRVFQDFATLDLLSGSRAEIMAGRGSFIESFPLFGYDLADYDELFAEKLELLLRLREAERVTWSGQHRPALDDLGVYPRPLQDRLPISVAVGSPKQVIEKILFQHEIFGHQRFLLQFSVGTLPHRSIMRSIELFGTRVAPIVRRAIEYRTASTSMVANATSQSGRRADAAHMPR
jgi:alkanesulfonate monooxygenase SsuD/methylene tetrahydromethanopterin reductase-like flavin-dependent oxidoreductase (luciferase family)